MSETGRYAWFFSRDGQQSGPLTFDEIREKAKEGVLRPRTDLVWREGMADWKPVGEVEGFFDRAPVAAPEEIVREDPYGATARYEADGLAETGIWPGIRRRTYFLATFVLPFVVGLALPYVTKGLDAAVVSRVMEVASPTLVIVAIFAGIQRLANVGMSRWWYFGMVVPILNLWLAYRIFACPGGYAHHRKMGGAGIFLAIVFWLTVVAVLLLIAAAAAVLLGAAGDPELRRKVQEIIEQAQAARR